MYDRRRNQPPCGSELPSSISLTSLALHLLVQQSCVTRSGSAAKKHLALKPVPLLRVNLCSLPRRLRVRRESSHPNRELLRDFSNLQPREEINDASCTNNPHKECRLRIVNRNKRVFWLFNHPKKEQMLPCLLQRGAEHVWGRGTPTTTKLQQQYYIPRYATDLTISLF